MPPDLLRARIETDRSTRLALPAQAEAPLVAIEALNRAFPLFLRYPPAILPHDLRFLSRGCHCFPVSGLEGPLDPSVFSLPLVQLCPEISTRSHLSHSEIIRFLSLVNHDSPTGAHVAQPRHLSDLRRQYGRRQDHLRHGPM